MSVDAGEFDWSTEAGLAEIKTSLAARLPGWRQPLAYAVGLAPAAAAADPGAWEFPHVNAPGGRHGLPAVVLGTVLGHDGSTATVPVTAQQLGEAVAILAPAHACTTVDHPNLGAWRGILAVLQGDPTRRVVAVFVADLADPVSSDAEASYRALMTR